MPATPTPIASAILAGDADQLDHLLRQLFPLDTTAEEPLSRPALVQRLCEFDHGAGAALVTATQPQAGMAALTPSDHGLLCFIDLFWTQLRAHGGLHETLLDTLDWLRPQLAVAALTSDDWFDPDRHPLWSLLARLHAVGIGYQPELARGADKLPAELDQALAPARDGDWQQALAALETYTEQERARLQRLEQRLHDSERGQLRTRRAQQQAAKLLNQRMAGHRLPGTIAEFLQSYWYQELHWCLLHHGEDSDGWRRRAALTEQLIASLQPADEDDVQRQALYELIPPLGPELRELLNERAHDPVLLEKQLAMVEHLHVSQLKGSPLTYAPFELIANHDPWLSHASISRDLLARVGELQPGQWFLNCDSTPEQRIKLSLKMDETAQLLFVNRLGMKALQKSFEEFAYLLASGAVVALPQADIAQHQLGRLIEQLEASYAEQERSRSEALAAAQAQAALEQQRRAEARAKAIAEAQAQAEMEAQLKAAAEQAAREQEQARRQAVLEQQADDAAQRQRSARQTVSTFAIGTWIELHDDLGGSQRLKLAVKLPSSSKLIFVDREGLQRTELTHEQLVARLLDGSAQVQSQGPQFEDTLARVVDSLRRDRAGKE